MEVDVMKERAETPRELVDLYSDDIWRFASSQVPRREDAEDIVMDVFAAAFASFPKLTRVDDQRLWLLGIARKKMAKALRMRYRRAEQPLNDEHVAMETERSELQEAVWGALGAVPSPQAEALVLKYVNGLSTEEVAQVLRKSLPATNSLLQRARETLRTAVSDSNPELVRSTS
jgi:RNA polymerase sigma-70 factor (ECF subfamily)